MKIGKIIACFLSAAVFAACSLEPFEDTPNVAGPVSPDKNIKQESSLFVNAGENDAFAFETNDTKYIGSRGYTLWSVKDTNKEESFVPISVRLTKYSGRAEAGFGMVFCEQEIDGKPFMLTVLLNANGLYAVGKIVNGSFIHLNNGWKYSNAIGRGLGISNDVYVSYSTENDNFELKINGQEITKFSVGEKLTFKNSHSGYVVVIASNEDFPSKPVKVTYRKN